jgi:hypothetical protein
VAVVDDPFLTASVALDRIQGQVRALAYPFANLLPVSGASVSTFGPLLGAETVSATDARAGRIDELQFDLGQGPCWDALSTRRPVLEPDLATSASWPAFIDAVRNERVAAIFAFPLVLGPLEIGAVDLYSADRVALTEEQQRQALALCGIVSRLLLRHVIADRGSDVPTPFSRRLIHQATGMVLTQMKISADDAYLIIQARAFADGRSMRDVAEDIIERRIRFTASTADGGERS